MHLFIANNSVWMHFFAIKNSVYLNQIWKETIRTWIIQRDGKLLLSHQRKLRTIHANWSSRRENNGLPMQRATFHYLHCAFRLAAITRMQIAATSERRLQKWENPSQRALEECNYKPGWIYDIFRAPSAISIRRKRSEWEKAARAATKAGNSNNNDHR